MGRLTKAQERVLRVAERSNGVAAPYGPSKVPLIALIKMGLLSKERDALGYHLITDEGRAALKETLG